MVSVLVDKMINTLVPKEFKEPKILCVGLICFDVVQLCEHYIMEDSKKRCIDLIYQRGGNASNSCTVLSQLGYPCELLGVLSDDDFSKFLKDDLCKNNIEFSHCSIAKGGSCPISTVILSAATGSRTILHHPGNIGEVTLPNLEKIDLREYSWIHFEGRNVDDIILMIQYIKTYNKSLIHNNKEKGNESNVNDTPITVSVEIEKTDPYLLNMLPHTDVAFISKDFAQSRGYDSMNETLKHIKQNSKTGTTIINAWGDRGAMALAPDGGVVQSPPYPPKTIIDTLGAGDTFNASTIYYLNKRKLEFSTTMKSSLDKINYNKFINRECLQEAITFGCQIAGAKIGLRGYEGLNAIYKNFRSTFGD